MFFMPLLYLWGKADRMLLRHALLDRFSQLHLSPLFRSFCFFLIKEAVLWCAIRSHSHTMDVLMLLFFIRGCRPFLNAEWLSSCYHDEEASSRKPRGITSRRTRSLQHPRAWRLLVLMS
jgi:hypothetical protein